MTVTIRPYDHAVDYERAHRFLVELYEPGDTFANWLAPRWEYMHYHPLIAGVPLDRIGMVEEDGRHVGVVQFEHSLAYAYFQVRPGSDHIKPEMVAWAEQHLGGESRALGRPILGLFVDHFDEPLRQVAAARGFQPSTEFSEQHSRYRLDRPVPRAPLPEGFRLQSLADENDLRLVNRVLWRGFNHEGPPPEEEIPGLAALQGAPNFRRELTIVAVAPDGAYVSYAGMWHVPENRVGYVEPVATDPAFRRMGFGRAVVLEALRRVAALGADVAWVGSGQEFYRAIGFETMFESQLWVKELG